MRISQKCACTGLYDFLVTSFYVILQAAGLGYLIGGSIIVSTAADYKSESGKLNFWRHCNKGAVDFDSIKTLSAGGYN